MGEERPRARGCRKGNRLPNGDNRRRRGGATNEVIATPRGQAQQRVAKTPEIGRPLQPTAWGGYIKRAAGGKDPGPKYRHRGLRTGASGHSRQARQQSRVRE